MARRHLVRTGSGHQRVSACGLHDPRIWTHDPAAVDCLACARTLYMADAELRKQQRQQRKHREVQ